MNGIDRGQVASVDRNSLREQVARILRDMIINGKVKPGTKITERDVADLLKISRMPARDALLDLERQGLVISRPGARYVIELTEKDIRNLYQIRLALEKLAIQQAIANLNDQKIAALKDQLAAMQQSVRDHQQSLFTSSDIEFHELIWEASDNPYLAEMLRSMIGPIFMFISVQTRFQETWEETLDLHEELVQYIDGQNEKKAIESIEKHMRVSLNLALKAFENPGIQKE